MDRNILYGAKKIPFTLTYQNRKSLGIKVHPDITVHVLAPEGTDESEVMKKVKAKAPWIVKQMEHFNSFPNHSENVKTLGKLYTRRQDYFKYRIN